MVQRTRRVLMTLFVVVGCMAALGRLAWHTDVFSEPPTPEPSAAATVPVTAPVERVVSTAEPAAARSAPVLRVYDGDTVLVRLDGREERVRLIGVDTPEAPREDRPGHPGHAEATKVAKELIGSGPVRLISDERSRNRDTYDRLLRHVVVQDGEHLSDALIERGLGFAVVQYSHSRIREVIELEQEARAAGRGLWSPDRVDQVSWREAPERLGEVVNVQGKFVATHNTGRICFLNFHENYREHLTAVIFEPSFPLFPERPERFYKGKNVRLLGRVTEYRGRPQVRVHAPDQIVLVP
jgi:endonuclease YncB( thermonuclease family)